MRVYKVELYGLMSPIDKKRPDCVNDQDAFLSIYFTPINIHFSNDTL